MTAPPAFLLGRDMLVIADPDVAAWIARALRSAMRQAAVDGVGRPPDAVRLVAERAEELVMRVTGAGLVSPGGSVEVSPVTDPVSGHEGWVSVGVGADRLRCSEQWVRKLCRSEHLTAERTAQGWQIEPKSLEAYMRNHDQRGAA